MSSELERPGNPPVVLRVACGTIHVASTIAVAAFIMVGMAASPTSE